jgi:hypothetical protein
MKMRLAEMQCTIADGLGMSLDQINVWMLSCLGLLRADDREILWCFCMMSVMQKHHKIQALWILSSW